jgi:hypothetical protein
MNMQGTPEVEMVKGCAGRERPGEERRDAEASLATSDN